MPDALKPFLRRLAAGAQLTAPEAEAAFGTVMDGQASPAQIAALLTALHMRGETTDELAGAVQAMRARMTRIDAPPDAIDMCGTGGDGLATLNVSTATAFVVAACGVPVAKHGNRALSSRAGAADVLEALGLRTGRTPAELAAQLRETGLAFLFAPNHHPALRHAAGVRAELGFRTIFNLTGPLCSPAVVRRQVVGVYDPRWLEPMAATLGALGTQHAWVVHGPNPAKHGIESEGIDSGGIDELTLAGETLVCAWQHGRLRHFTVAPEDAGLPRAPVSAITGGDAAHNAAALRALLAGQPGAYRDTVLLNAAACLAVADRAASLRHGAVRAAEAIDRGDALALLHRLLHPAPDAERDDQGRDDRARDDQGRDDQGRDELCGALGR